MISSAICGKAATHDNAAGTQVSNTMPNIKNFSCPAKQLLRSNSLLCALS